MTTACDASSNTFEIFVVGTFANSNVGSFVGGTLAGGPSNVGGLELRLSGGNALVRSGAFATFITASYGNITPGTTVIFNIQSASGVVTLYAAIGATLIQLGSTGTPAFSDGSSSTVTSLGSRGSGGAYTDFFTGSISFVGKYVSLLSTADRATVMAYLDATFGEAALLKSSGTIDGWWDATLPSTVTTSSGLATAWADRSGRGLTNVTFTTAGPTYPPTSGNQINGLNTIVSTGNSIGIQNTSFSVPSSLGFTWFSVAHLGAAGNGFNNILALSPSTNTTGGTNSFGAVYYSGYGEYMLCNDVINNRYYGPGAVAVAVLSGYVAYTSTLPTTGAYCAELFVNGGLNPDTSMNFLTGKNTLTSTGLNVWMSSGTNVVNSAEHIIMDGLLTPSAMSNIVRMLGSKYNVANIRAMTSYAPYAPTLAVATATNAFTCPKMCFDASLPWTITTNNGVGVTGTVTSWADQITDVTSGTFTPHNAVPDATATGGSGGNSAPTWTAGNNYLTFSGNQVLYSQDEASSSGTWEMFVVASVTSFATTQAIIGGVWHNGINGASYAAGGMTVSTGAGPVLTISDGPAAAVLSDTLAPSPGTGMTIYNIRCVAGVLSVYVGPELQLLSGGGTASFTANTVLCIGGAGFASNVYGNLLTGNVGFVCKYNVVLTPLNRAAVVNYLDATFSMAVSGDTVEASLASIGAIVDYRIDPSQSSTVTTSSGLATAIMDISGSAAGLTTLYTLGESNVTQYPPTTQPKINSLNTLTLDHTGFTQFTYLASGTATSPTTGVYVGAAGFTFFIVCQWTSVFNGEVPFLSVTRNAPGQSNSLSFNLHQSGGTLKWAGGTPTGTPSFSYNTPYIISGFFASSSTPVTGANNAVECFVNGGTAAAYGTIGSNTFTFNAYQNIVLDYDYDHGSGNVTYGDVIIVDGIIPAASMNAVVATLGTKWGITVSTVAYV